MDKKKIINYHTTEDFILDREFTTWVLHPEEEIDLWNSFVSEHPEKEKLIADAILIIKSLQPIKEQVPQERLDLILNKIEKPSRTVRFNWEGGFY